MIINNIYKQTVMKLIVHNKLLMRCDQDDLESMIKYITVCAP